MEEPDVFSKKTYDFCEQKPVVDKKELMKLKKQADAKAIKLVHAFIKKYLELDENNEPANEANEGDLINALYDLYDPPKQV